MLTLLHTAESNVAVFEALRKEIAPDLAVDHLVADDILQSARVNGRADARMARRVAEIYATLGKRFEFVLCTCSTIGEIAERESLRFRFPVLRVDRPMARAAVAHGSRVVILATLRSTLEPTRALLVAEAQHAGRPVQIDEILCTDAWAHMESGNVPAYADAITRTIDAVAARHDVVVLAQASMAVAADSRPSWPIPVLSSPRSGFTEAVAQYRAFVEVAAQMRTARP